MLKLSEIAKNEENLNKIREIYKMFNAQEIKLTLSWELLQNNKIKSQPFQKR